MRFRIRKKYLYMIPFAFLPLVYNNCASPKFEGVAQESVSSVGDPVDPPPVVPTPVPEVPSVTYSTDVIFSKLTSVPLDVVWIIDNSGSMDAEAAHVRTNFKSFIDSLATLTEIKVALISKSGTSGTAVSLPVTGPNYLAINQTVDSRNPLQLLMRSICNPEISSACQNNGVTTSTNSVLDGKIASFLRPGSKKVFVFVTDDNSNVAAASYNNIAAAAFPDAKPTIFGFIGLGAMASPCQAAQGSVYQTLASETGGSVFNICDQVWTSTFNELKDNVSKLITHSFPVPENLRNAEVLSVHINNQPIDSSKYSISAAGQFQLDREIAESFGQGTVKIVYRPK